MFRPRGDEDYGGKDGTIASIVDGGTVYRLVRSRFLQSRVDAGGKIYLHHGVGTGNFLSFWFRGSYESFLGGARAETKGIRERSLLSEGS